MKDLLVLGTGISGKSAINSIPRKDVNIFVFDDLLKSPDDIPSELKNKNIHFLFSYKEVLEKNFDFVMKSPGIKPNHKLVKELKKRKVKVISDLELGYLYKTDVGLITVTGTNGKTTTTTLINEVINSSNFTSDAVGNIGKGAVESLIKTEKDFLVIEASSFQLDDIDKYKSEISIITNIDVDHLDYHKTKENYIKAKLNLIKNLGSEDYLVLNYDDRILRNIKGNFKKIYVSTEKELDSGFYYKDGIIYRVKSDEKSIILKTKDLKILGRHNYYNIMFALAVGEILRLNLDTALNTVYNFSGVKHRLEYVREYNQRKFYNDSKGTNTQSTKMAINAFERPINIILGGYDKGEDFFELLKFGKDKIRSIYTLGETKDRIYKEAKELGYDIVYKVETLEEGILGAYSSSLENDIILLSPACASWDMYKNFKERGNEFIKIVNELE